MGWGRTGEGERGEGRERGERREGVGLTVSCGRQVGTYNRFNTV